jgi:hypothetical protein
MILSACMRSTHARTGVLSSSTPSSCCSSSSLPPVPHRNRSAPFFRPPPPSSTPPPSPPAPSPARQTPHHEHTRRRALARRARTHNRTRLDQLRERGRVEPAYAPPPRSLARPVHALPGHGCGRRHGCEHKEGGAAQPVRQRWRGRRSTGSACSTLSIASGVWLASAVAASLIVLRESASVCSSST